MRITRPIRTDTKKFGLHCDLLIVGAGPAGLAAALTAARSGAKTIVVDEGSELGGSLLIESATLGGRPAADALANLIAELRSFPNLRLLARATAVGWYDDMVFAVVERAPARQAARGAGEPVERLWRIVAKRALLCTGAEERPLVFGGNDRPGVMMADAGLDYARRYGVAVGGRVAIFASHGGGARTARALAECGVEVVSVVDAREDAARHFNVRQPSADRLRGGGWRAASTFGY